MALQNETTGHFNPKSLSNHAITYCLVPSLYYRSYQYFGFQTYLYFDLKIYLCVR